MKACRSTIFILCLLVLSPAGAGYQIAIPASGTQVAGPQRATSLAKAGFRLSRLFAAYRQHVATQGSRPFRPRDGLLQFQQGRVLVEARATEDGAVLLGDLSKLGLRNGRRFGIAVSGLLPVAAIRQAAALQSLRSIHAALPPVNNTGSVTSQGDVALRADIARSTHGLDGSGVTVGVMSDSYNVLSGAAADITSGDLPPAGVTVINGESGSCGSLIFCIDEGRAMLQIVHDIAPGADLLFHTALSSTVDFANGIAALAAAGADLIVDDLLYLNEPMFEDGIVAQAVDAVAADGVAYYSAAGNQGRQSYESGFDDSGEYLCLEWLEPIGDCNYLYERVGKMHDFDPGPGQHLFQSITIPYNATLTIALQWDEAFGNARTDHDVVLLDATGNAWYEFGANDNVSTGEGWEVLQFTNDEFLGPGTTEFTIAITYDDVDSVGPPAGLIKAIYYGNGVTINDFPTDSGTLIGHANAAGATAVGAAFFLETPEFGVDPPQLEPYSAAGGTPILFGAGGSRLSVPVVRLKPEVVAIDGVNTTFFFSDSYGDDGIDDFFGTSAAAPHAAGVAALLREADPSATPNQLETVLAGSAIDMLAGGFDHDSGYGLIQADAAVAALSSAANLAPVASFEIGSITGLSVDFTDTSNDPDGAISVWDWDFGGDGASSLRNPTHGFSTAGTYSVTLTVTDNEGAMDAFSQQVTVSDTAVNTAPVAAFSYNCSGTDCMFSDRSSDPDPGDVISAWAWDFGDGEFSSSRSPSHSYASHGNYTVVLEVTDDNAATGSVSATFRVKNRGNVSGTVGDSGGGGDPGGTTNETERGKKKCSDGLDNDGDGLVDGADPECQ
jgi:PKD repeat protein